MEELPRKNNSLESDSSCFHATDVLAKKHQEQRQSIMFEGKNIHSSPIDGKLLCSYSEKVCKQRRLNGYAFCIRHVLEDRQAPFKQCQFVAKYNGHQCTNPIPLSQERIYCNSHLQVLGLVPKKSKRKKACESGGGETDQLILAPEQKRRPDVFSTPASTNNLSKPTMAFPFRLKRPKLKSQDPTEPKIPAVEELKESRRKLRRDRNDLFAIYGIDSSDSESSDSEKLPWQQMWLSSDNEHKAVHEDTENSCSGDAATRTAKISKLSSRLRRELHQLRRSLRAHRYRSKDLRSLSTALLRAAHTDTGVCVESLFQGNRASRSQRTKPTPCPQKVCASVQNESQCTKTALPYTKFCLDHIMSESKQGLYAQCTAKWPGGLQCSVPVFDISHERPLCEEHALKKAKSQEAQVQAQVAAVAKSSPVLIKQQPQKPRRKPQPRATPGTKVPRPAKKPPSRKSTPRSKLKTSKGLDVSLTGGVNHSFSPDNSAEILSPSMTLPLSSDYSHNSDPSPMSSDLTDFEQFGNTLFESHQQDSLLLSNASDGDSGDNILSGDLPPTANGTLPEQHMFHGIEKRVSPVAHIPQWSSTSSIPASVISSTMRAHGSGTPLNSSRMGTKTDPKSKSSAVNRKNKGSQPPKPREPKKSQSQSKQPRSSLTNMLQNSRFISNDLYARDKSVKHLILDDPMFSPPHGLSSTGELKSHSNGEHVHSPPHVGMDMGAMLSPTQRAWSSVPGGTSPAAYISPLNSQTSISRLTSPPFSSPSISPHISPHPTLGSLFTFDKTQLQQTHLGTPPSPLPFMQSGQLKQPFHHRHNDLGHQDSDVDPFLPSVEREQSIFGSHFTPNSDSNLGDLRLR